MSLANGGHTYKFQVLLTEALPFPQLDVEGALVVLAEQDGRAGGLVGLSQLGSSLPVTN